MQQVYIPLVQTWDNLDEAIKYFQEVIADLEVLKGLAELPTDLYLSVRTGDSNLDDDVIAVGAEIILRNL